MAEQREVKTNVSDMLFGDEFSVPDVEAAEADVQGGDPDQPVKGRKYRKEIDLGDGSGKQVFEADSPTELIDKLADAQVNASRELRKVQRQSKIRNMVPAVPDQKITQRKQFTPQPLSKEEAFMLVQQNPERIGEVIFQREMGMSPTEFRAEFSRLQSVAQNSIEERAGMEFLADHQGDYLPNKENGDTIDEFLKRNSLAVTRQNLEYAFAQLSAAELLEAPVQDTDDDDEIPTGKKTRIEAPAKKKKTMSGLSSTMSQDQPEPEDTIASEAEEIRNLNIPLAQKRERIVSLMHKARQAQSRS